MSEGVKSTIISGFPGIGKSYFKDRSEIKICIDLDSSRFSHRVIDGQKIKNPDFPQNYVRAIKGAISKHYYILISSHKEVRHALEQEGISINLVYPTIERKEEFLQRYRDRGDTAEFIEFMSENWEEFINDIEKEASETFLFEFCRYLPLEVGEVDYLSDILIV